MSRYVFVTGGVLSSLGKGITASSLGALLKASGINVNETLNNPNFQPHPALGVLLSWLKTHAADLLVRNAATRASTLYAQWESKNQPKAQQLKLFDNLGEEVF